MVKVKVFSLVKDKGVGVITTFDKSQSLSSTDCDRLFSLINTSMVECGFNPEEDLALVVSWDYGLMDALVERIRAKDSKNGVTNLAFLDLKTRKLSKQSLVNFISDFYSKTPELLDAPNFQIHSFTHHVNNLYGEMKATHVSELYEDIIPHRVI